MLSDALGPNAPDESDGDQPMAKRALSETYHSRAVKLIHENTFTIDVPGLGVITILNPKSTRHNTTLVILLDEANVQNAFEVLQYDLSLADLKPRGYLAQGGQRAEEKDGAVTRTEFSDFERGIDR